MAMAFFQPKTVAESKQTVEVAPALQPWVEKYRPRTIDDVSAQEHTVTVLRKALSSANLPHMLFYGPPGTGKTSTILALSRQLFGPDNFRERVLELNASDERGISIVREKIKTFARQTPRAQKVSSDGNSYPCPPYKIIILDEADSMTQDAQGALRRIMETYARITRFCLVCNYVTRIIEPLASRCSKFRFTPLDSSSTSSRLMHIAAAEHVDVSPEVVAKLIDASNGDLRRSITYLQSASRLSSSTTPPTPITPRDIEEIAGVVPTAVVNNFAQTLGIDTEHNDMQTDDTLADSKRENFDVIRKKVKFVMREGYSASQLLIQLHDEIIVHQTLPARQKAKCVMAIAEADKALCEGADEELWTLEVALQIHKALAS
ncbi:P-loop containing nucleoside triphosphate hydrolase protein [Chiua virens]|nr:P-loop containing nucleoside triphosphate hydrolase protein [Chiua virens]